MTLDFVRAPLPVRRLSVIVTSLSSDAHTWNLVFLQMLLEEMGCRVTNLGACTPDEVIVRECLARRPDLIVVGTLNGHGLQDGLRLIGALRDRPGLVRTPVVIGGRLDTTGESGGRTATLLLEAGFDAVFDGAAGLGAFRSLVHTLAVGSGAPIDVT